MTKTYKLLDADGHFYSSNSKRLLGGNARAKIYGRFDCPAALRAIARGKTYEHHRVFFADEATAIGAGFVRVPFVCVMPIRSGARAPVRIVRADRGGRERIVILRQRNAR